ncbi:hypothetical protein MMJ01_09085, partial [Enterococcus cecorum]|nr:hypothetical protein [Enterococcus cecorum]
PTLLYHKVRKSTSVKLKKFDKKIALYQGIERKYFNSTVKLPDLSNEEKAKLTMNEVLHFFEDDFI